MLQLLCPSILPFIFSNITITMSPTIVKLNHFPKHKTGSGCMVWDTQTATENTTGVHSISLRRSGCCGKIWGYQCLQTVTRNRPLHLWWPVVCQFVVISSLSSFSSWTLNMLLLLLFCTYFLLDHKHKVGAGRGRVNRRGLKEVVF